jgi:hypothetical protein
MKKNPAYNAETAANHFKNLTENKFQDNQFKAMLAIVSDSAHAGLITHGVQQVIPKHLAIHL